MAQGGVAPSASASAWVTREGPVASDPGYDVPSNLGHLRKKSETSGEGRWVIHIQDAHQSLAAQKSIAKLLENLTSRYELDLVGLEGSSGMIDATLVSSFPVKPVREEAAGALLEQTRISGAEFHQIISQEKIELYGLEDPELYASNIDRFQKLLEGSDRFYTALGTLKKLIRRLEERVYSEEALSFFKTVRAHEAGEMEFKVYWEVIRKKLASAPKRLAAAPELQKLVEANTIEDEIDFERATDEREMLLETLKTRLPKEKLEALVNEAAEYKLGKLSPAKFHLKLCGAAKLASVSPVAFLHLVLYTRYALLFESVDLLALNQEIYGIEAELAAGVLQSQDEKTLYALSQTTEILAKLLEGKLSRRDEAYLAEHPEALDLARMRLELDRLRKKNIPVEFFGVDFVFLSQKVPLARDFYRAVKERNEILIQNLTRRMREKNVRVAALVSGGFHSEDLSDLLSQNRVSHLVVLPKFDGKGTERPYLTIITQKGSFLDRKIRTEAQMEAIALVLASSVKNGLRPDEARRLYADSYRKAQREAGRLETQDTSDSDSGNPLQDAEAALRFTIRFDASASSPQVESEIIDRDIYLKTFALTELRQAEKKHLESLELIRSLKSSLEETGDDWDGVIDRARDRFVAAWKSRRILSPADWRGAWREASRSELRKKGIAELSLLSTSRRQAIERLLFEAERELETALASTPASDKRQTAQKSSSMPHESAVATASIFSGSRLAVLDYLSAIQGAAIQKKGPGVVEVTVPLRRPSEEPAASRLPSAERKSQTELARKPLEKILTRLLSEHQILHWDEATVEAVRDSLSRVTGNEITLSRTSLQNLAEEILARIPDTKSRKISGKKVYYNERSDFADELERHPSELAVDGEVSTALEDPSWREVRIRAETTRRILTEWNRDLGRDMPSDRRQAGRRLKEFLLELVADGQVINLDRAVEAVSKRFPFHGYKDDSTLRAALRRILASIREDEAGSEGRDASRFREAGRTLTWIDAADELLEQSMVRVISERDEEWTERLEEIAASVMELAQKGYIDNLTWNFRQAVEDEIRRQGSAIAPSAIREYLQSRIFLDLESRMGEKAVTQPIHTVRQALSALTVESFDGRTARETVIQTAIEALRSLGIPEGDVRRSRVLKAVSDDMVGAVNRLRAERDEKRQKERQAAIQKARPLIRQFLESFRFDFAIARHRTVPAAFVLDWALRTVMGQSGLTPMDQGVLLKEFEEGIAIAQTRFDAERVGFDLKTFEERDGIFWILSSDHANWIVRFGEQTPIFPATQVNPKSGQDRAPLIPYTEIRVPTRGTPVADSEDHYNAPAILSGEAGPARTVQARVRIDRTDKKPRIGLSLSKPEGETEYFAAVLTDGTKRMELSTPEFKAAEWMGERNSFVIEERQRQELEDSLQVAFLVEQAQTRLPALRYSLGDLRSSVERVRDEWNTLFSQEGLDTSPRSLAVRGAAESALRDDFAAAVRRLDAQIAKWDLTTFQERGGVRWALSSDRSVWILQFSENAWAYPATQDFGTGKAQGLIQRYAEIRIPTSGVPTGGNADQYFVETVLKDAAGRSRKVGVSVKIDRTEPGAPRVQMGLSRPSSDSSYAGAEFFDGKDKKSIVIPRVKAGQFMGSGYKKLIARERAVSSKKFHPTAPKAESASDIAARRAEHQRRYDEMIAEARVKTRHIRDETIPRLMRRVEEAKRLRDSEPGARLARGLFADGRPIEPVTEMDHLTQRLIRIQEHLEQGEAALASQEIEGILFHISQIREATRASDGPDFLYDGFESFLDEVGQAASELQQITAPLATAERDVAFDRFVEETFTAPQAPVSVAKRKPAATPQPAAPASAPTAPSAQAPRVLTPDEAAERDRAQVMAWAQLDGVRHTLDRLTHLLNRTGEFGTTPGVDADLPDEVIRYLEDNGISFVIGTDGVRRFEALERRLSEAREALTPEDDTLITEATLVNFRNALLDLNREIEIIFELLSHFEPAGAVPADDGSAVLKSEDAEELLVEKRPDDRLRDLLETLATEIAALVEPIEGRLLPQLGGGSASASSLFGPAPAETPEAKAERESKDRTRLFLLRAVSFSIAAVVMLAVGTAIFGFFFNEKDKAIIAALPPPAAAAPGEEAKQAEPPQTEVKLVLPQLGENEGDELRGDAWTSPPDELSKARWQLVRAWMEMRAVRDLALKGAFGDPALGGFYQAEIPEIPVDANGVPIDQRWDARDRDVTLIYADGTKSRISDAVFCPTDKILQANENRFRVDRKGRFHPPKGKTFAALSLDTDNDFTKTGLRTKDGRLVFDVTGRGVGAAAGGTWTGHRPSAAVPVFWKRTLRRIADGALATEIFDKHPGEIRRGAAYVTADGTQSVYDLESYVYEPPVAARPHGRNGGIANTVIFGVNASQEARDAADHRYETALARLDLFRKLNNVPPDMRPLLDSLSIDDYANYREVLKDTMVGYAVDSNAKITRTYPTHKDLPKIGDEPGNLRFYYHSRERELAGGNPLISYDPKIYPGIRPAKVVVVAADGSDGDEVHFTVLGNYELKAAIENWQKLKTRVLGTIAIESDFTAEQVALAKESVPAVSVLMKDPAGNLIAFPDVTYVIGMIEFYGKGAQDNFVLFYNGDITELTVAGFTFYRPKDQRFHALFLQWLDQIRSNRVLHEDAIKSLLKGPLAGAAAGEKQRIKDQLETAQKVLEFLTRDYARFIPVDEAHSFQMDKRISIEKEEGIAGVVAAQGGTLREGDLKALTQNDGGTLYIPVFAAGDKTKIIGYVVRKVVGYKENSQGEVAQKFPYRDRVNAAARNVQEPLDEEGLVYSLSDGTVAEGLYQLHLRTMANPRIGILRVEDPRDGTLIRTGSYKDYVDFVIGKAAIKGRLYEIDKLNARRGGLVWISAHPARHNDPALTQRFGPLVDSPLLPSASGVSIDTGMTRVVGKKETGQVFDQQTVFQAEVLLERHLQTLENMRLEAIRLGQPDRARQFHQEMITAIRSRSFSPPIGTVWGGSRITLDGYALTGQTLPEQLNGYLDDLWFILDGAIERERMNETGGVIQYAVGARDQRLSILDEMTAWIYPETLLPGKGGVAPADSHFGSPDVARNRAMAESVAAEIRRQGRVEWHQRELRTAVVDTKEKRVTTRERKRAEKTDSLEELLELRNRARSKRVHVQFIHQDPSAMPESSRVVQAANAAYETYLRKLNLEVRRLKLEVQEIEADLRASKSHEQLRARLQHPFVKSDGLERTYADRKVEFGMKERELDRNRKAYMFVDRSKNFGEGDKDRADDEFLVAVIASPDAARKARNDAVEDFATDAERLKTILEALRGAREAKGGFTLSIPGKRTQDKIFVGEEWLAEAQGWFEEVRRRVLEGTGKKPDEDYLAVLMGYKHTADLVGRRTIEGWARGMDRAGREALLDGWIHPDPARDGKGYFLIRGTAAPDGLFKLDWEGKDPNSQTFMLVLIHGVEKTKTLRDYHARAHELVLRACRAIGNAEGLVRVNHFPESGDTRNADKIPDVLIDANAVLERRAELLRQLKDTRIAYERAAAVDKPALAERFRVLEDGIEALDELVYIHQHGFNEARVHWNELRREALTWNPSEVTLEGRDPNGMLTGDAVVFKRDPATGKAVGPRIRTYQKQRLLSDPENGELISVVRVVDHLRGLERYDWIRIDVPIVAGGGALVPQDLIAKSKMEVRAPGVPRDGPISGYLTTRYEYLPGTVFVSKSQTHFSDQPQEDFGRPIESAELLLKDGEPRRMSVDPRTGDWSDDPNGQLTYRVTGSSEGLKGEAQNHTRIELRDSQGHTVAVENRLFDKAGADGKLIQSSVSLRALSPWGEIQSETNWVTEYSLRPGENPVHSATRTDFKSVNGRRVPDATVEIHPATGENLRVRHRYEVELDLATSLQTVTVSHGDGRFFAKRLETPAGQPLRILQDGILSVIDYAESSTGFLETNRTHFLRNNPADRSLEPKVDPARPVFPGDPARFDGRIIEDKTLERLADRTVWIERTDLRFGSVQRIHQTADGNPIEIQWLQYESGPGSELVGVWKTRVLEMQDRTNGIWRHSTLTFEPRRKAEIPVATYELEGEDGIDRFIPDGLVPGRDLRKEFRDKYNDGSDRVLVVKVTKHGPKAVYRAVFPKRNRFGMIPVVLQQGHTITASGFVPASSIPSESFVFHQNTLERSYKTDFDPVTGKLVTDSAGNTRATASYPDGTKFRVFSQPLNPEGTQAYEISHDGYRFEIEWDNPKKLPSVPFGVRPSTRIIDPDGNFLGRYSYSRSVTTHQGTPDEETVHEYSVEWFKTSKERSIDTSLMTAVFRNNGDKLYEVYGEKKTTGGMQPTKVLYYINNKPFLVRDYATGHATAVFLVEPVKDAAGRVRPGEYRVWEFPLQRDGEGRLFVQPKPIDGYTYKEYRNERLARTRHNRFIETNEAEQAALVKQFDEAFRSSLMMNLLREAGALEGKIPQAGVPDLRAAEEAIRKNPLPILPIVPEGGPAGSRLAGFGAVGAGLRGLKDQLMDWLVLDDLAKAAARYSGLESAAAVFTVVGLVVLSLHLLRYWDVANWIPDGLRFLSRAFRETPKTPTRETLRPEDTGTEVSRTHAMDRQITQMNYALNRLDAVATIHDLDLLTTTAFPGKTGFEALGFSEADARTLNDLFNPNVTWVPTLTYDQFKGILASVRAEVGTTILQPQRMRTEMVRRAVRAAFEPVVNGYMDAYGYYSEESLTRDLNDAEAAFAVVGGPDKRVIARLFPHSGLQLLTSIVPSQIPAPEAVEMIRKLRARLSAHHRITARDYTDILENSDAGGGRILKNHPFRYEFLNAFVELVGGDPVVRNEAVMRRDYLVEEIIERFMGYRLRRPEIQIGAAADGYFIPYSQAPVDLVEIPLESFVLSRMVYHTMRTRRPGLLLEAQERLKAMAPIDRKTRFLSELLRQDDLWAHVYSVIAYYIVENGTKQRNLLMRVLTQPSDLDRILYLLDDAFTTLDIPQNMSASFTTLIDYSDRVWHGMLPPNTASRLAVTPAEAQRELAKLNGGAKNLRNPGTNLVYELDKLIASPPAGGALPAGALDPALPDMMPVIARVKNLRDRLVLERNLPVGSAAEAKKADGLARELETLSIPLQHRALDGVVEDLRGLKGRFDTQLAAAATPEEREQAVLDAFAGLEQIDRGLAGRVNANAFDVGKGGPAAPRAAFLGRSRMVLELIARAFLGAKKAEYEKLAIPQMTYTTTYWKFLKFILGSLTDRRYLGLPADRPLRSLIAGWLTDPYFWDKQGAVMGLNPEEIAQSKRGFGAVAAIFRNTILYGSIMMFFILRYNLPRMIESKDYFYHAFPNNMWAGNPALLVAVAMQIIFFSTAWFFVLKNALRDRDRRVEDHTVRTSADVLTTLEILKGSPSGERVSAWGIAGTAVVLFGVLAAAGAVAGGFAAPLIALGFTALSQLVLFGGLGLAVYRALKDRHLVNLFSLEPFANERSRALEVYRLMIHSWDTTMTKFVDPMTRLKWLRLEGITLKDIDRLPPEAQRRLKFFLNYFYRRDLPASAREAGTGRALSTPYPDWDSMPQITMHSTVAGQMDFNWNQTRTQLYDFFQNTQVRAEWALLAEEIPGLHPASVIRLAQIKFPSAREPLDWKDADGVLDLLVAARGVPNRKRFQLAALTQDPSGASSLGISADPAAAASDDLESYIGTAEDLIRRGDEALFADPNQRDFVIASAKAHFKIQNPRYADLTSRDLSSLTDEELYELRLLDARIEGAYDEVHDTQAVLKEIQDSVHAAKSQRVIEGALDRESPATLAAKTESVKRALTDFTTLHTDTMVRIMTHYDQNLLLVYNLAEQYRPDPVFRSIKALLDPRGEKTIRQIRAEVAVQAALPAASRTLYLRSDGSDEALSDKVIAYFGEMDKFYLGMVREKVRFILQAVGNWVFTGSPDVAAQHQRLVNLTKGFELEVFLVEPSGKSLKPSKDGAMDFQQHLGRRITWWPDVSNVLPDPTAYFLWHAASLFDSDPKMALQLFNLRTSRDLNELNAAAGTNETGFGTVQAAVDELFPGGLDVYGKFGTQNDRMRGVIVPELATLKSAARSILGSRLAGAPRPTRASILVEGMNKLAILVRAAEDAAFAMGLKAEGYKTGFVGFVQVLQEKTNAFWMHDRQEWKYVSDVGELEVDEEATRAKLSGGSPLFKAATDLLAQFFVRKKYVWNLNRLFVGVVLLLGFNPWYGFPLPGLFVAFSYLYAQAISTPTLYQHQREMGRIKGAVAFLKKFPRQMLFSASGLAGTYDLAFTQDGLAGLPVFPATERAGWQIPMQPKESGWIPALDRYKALYEKPGPHHSILFASWTFPAFAVFSQFHPKVQLFAMFFTSALVAGFLFVPEYFNPGAQFFSKTYETAEEKYPSVISWPLRKGLKLLSNAGFFVYSFSRGIFETLVLSWARIEKRSNRETTLTGEAKFGIPISRNWKLVLGDKPLVMPIAAAIGVLAILVPGFAHWAVFLGLFMIFKSKMLYQELNGARYYREIRSFVEAQKIRHAAGPGGLIYDAGFDAAGNKRAGIDHPWQAFVEDLSAFTERPVSSYVKEVVWKDKAGTEHRRHIPNAYLFYALQKSNAEPNQMEVDLVISKDLLRQNPFLGVDSALLRIITPIKAVADQMDEAYTVPESDRQIRSFFKSSLTTAVGVTAVAAFLVLYFWTLPSISFTSSGASLQSLVQVDLFSHEWRNSLNFFLSALVGGSGIAGLGLVWVIRRISALSAWMRGVTPPAPAPTLAGELRAGATAPGVSVLPPRRSGPGSASGPAARLADTEPTTRRETWEESRFEVRVIVKDEAAQSVAKEAIVEASRILGLRNQIEAETVIAGSVEAGEAFAPSSKNTISILIDVSEINALENPAELKRQVALDLKGAWQDNLDRLERELQKHLTGLEADFAQAPDRELAILRAQMEYLSEALPEISRLGGGDTHLTLALLASLKEEARANAFIIPVALEYFRPIIDFESFETHTDINQTKEALTHQIEILREQAGVGVEAVILVRSEEAKVRAEAMNLSGRVILSKEKNVRDIFKDAGIPEEGTSQTVLITARKNDAKLSFKQTDGTTVLVVDTNASQDPGLFILRAYDTAVMNGDISDRIPGLARVAIETEDGQKVWIILMTPKPIDWKKVIEAAKLATQETAWAA